MRIKRTSITEVHWTLKWNPGTEANTTLARLLGPAMKYFAKCRIAAGFYQWDADGAGWLAMSQADPATKSAVAQRVGEIHNEIRSLSAANPALGEDMVEKILTNPNEDYTFFRTAEDGSMEVIFAGWGFCNFKRAEGMTIKKAIPKKESHPVRLAFRAKGELLANHPFSVLKLKAIEYSTDENGFFSLGDNVEVGTSLRLRSNVSDEEFTLLVQPVQSDYIFDVNLPEPPVEETPPEPPVVVTPPEPPVVETPPEPEPPTAIPVTVELRDKQNKIIPGAGLKFVNHLGKTEERRTDDAGRVTLDSSFFTDKKTVKVYPHVEGLKVSPCKLKYLSTNNFYVVNLHDKKYSRWLWLLPLLLLLLLFIRCDNKIVVSTLERDETPVEDVDVTLQYTEYQLYKDGKFFYKEDCTFTATSDANGEANFSGMPCSVFSHLFHPFAVANIHAERGVMRGDTTCNFHYTFHQTVYLTGGAKVRVLDARTGKRLPKARVSLKYTNPNADTDSIPSIVTDKNGEASLPLYDEQSLIEDMIVSKKGYSGKRIYQKTLVEAICDEKYVVEVYLDPPEACSDKSQDNYNGDMGDHCVRDYDMTKSSGTFQLPFYTDSAPDEIIVYDCPSSEISADKIIFHYSGATFTTTYTTAFVANIKFTSRYICVVINGGTNWGYVVRCPE